MSQNDPERLRFSFGRNWARYVESGLDSGTLAAARRHLEDLAKNAPDRSSFLDIGCGSGLFLVAALECGFERVIGFDYDPDSVATSRNLLSDRGLLERATVEEGDVLDEEYLEGLGTHPFVYAWGSLHHTGSMWTAIDRAARTVAPDGFFVLSIYNRSRSSAAWRFVKRTYNRSGTIVRRALVFLVWVVAAFAKALWTRRNPFRKDRGMSFYHDIVDWVGGFPYEFAAPDEVTSFLELRGFQIVQVRRGETPIACNEFLCRRRGETSPPGPS